MDTNNIRNLFKVKSTQVEKIEPIHNGKFIEPTVDERKQTYHDAGFNDSSKNNGNPRSLEICLNAIHAKFQNEESQNKHKQEDLKKPFFKEQGEKETELKGLNVTLENRERQIIEEQEKIKGVKTKIEDLELKISKLPENPGYFGVDANKGASVKFWIGIMLLVPITLYLFTFYISTSYSAFFKTFDPDATVIGSILDANAFEKAWEDGAIEGLFVTLIPFVFLGLGYLIHMFSENKKMVNYFKVGLLIVVTFIFDAILAYQIEYKLYEINKTFDSPPFDLSIALSTVEFWGIIFAGFLVYIIWGLVFDFIMKEHKERDKIKNAQDQTRRDIKIIEKRIDEHNKVIEVLRNEISSLKELIEKVKGRIRELQNIIDGIIIPSKEYVLYASEYLQGWTTLINSKIVLPENEKTPLVNSCKDIYDSHLTAVGASTPTTIYSSVV